LPHRLNLQHQWGVRVLGFYIHPGIELPLDAPHLKIADVGTATGQYLRDIEKLLPASAELHGFDISTVHFPVRGTYPSNLFFHEQDLRLPFDDLLLGSFDIINVRLIQMGLRSNDWEQAVKNLVSLLSSCYLSILYFSSQLMICTHPLQSVRYLLTFPEPGGYLQWIEPDHAASQILHNTPGAPSKASREVIGYFSEWCREHIYPGPLQLPELFVRNGLEIAVEEAFGTSRVQYETSYHTPMMLERLGKTVLDLKVEEGVMDGKSAEYLLDRAVMETRHGDVYQHSEIWVIVGRKIVGHMEEEE
jgi:SAM-dependent methyltransferase